MEDEVTGDAVTQLERVRQQLSQVASQWDNTTTNTPPGRMWAGDSTTAIPNIKPPLPPKTTLDTFPDAELIMEMIGRGYAVMPVRDLQEKLDAA